MYVITTDRKQAELVKNDYAKLYNRVNTFQYSDIYVITAANSNRSVIRKVFGETAVFIWGTIFNGKYFNEELLMSYESFSRFTADLKADKQNFFGHYVVILVHEESEGIEVVSDRIGMINTYYAKKQDDNAVCISDDLLEICRVSGNTMLCPQAVYEFLLTESNVGRFTLFENVFRLGFGRQIVLRNGELVEKDIYGYNIEKLDIEAYIERIERYFSCFCNYKGKITSDLSAGYDTRTVVAMAYKVIGQFAGFTHARHDDEGCDKETAGLIAEKLHIPFYYVDYCEERNTDQADYLEVLRETSVLRDAKRSQSWPILFTKKYGKCDLAFGGLGGEVLRGKYNDFIGIEDFVSVYYRGNEAEKVCGFAGYSQNVQRELKQYRLPQNMKPEMLPNWYYAVAKMRIWGSGCVHLASLYGDVVHPLMDWYLLNPIFGFEKKELQEAKLQMRLVEIFAPELAGIPINGVPSGKRAGIGAVLKEYAERCPKMRTIGTSLRCRYRNRKEKAQMDVPENIPEELLDIFAVETRDLLTCKGKSIADRMQTVLHAYAYVRS